MSKSRKNKWVSAHGRGVLTGGKAKHVFAGEKEATAYAAELDAAFGDAWWVFTAYPCRYGDDWRRGETYPEHWHAGRRKR